MNLNDTAQMMRRCLETIEEQRAQIAYLTPKAEAYDRMGALLDVVQRNGNRQLVGVGEDVTWRLRREIETIEARMQAEKRATRPEPDYDEKREGGGIDRDALRREIETARAAHTQEGKREGSECLDVQQERSTVEGVGHLHLG